MQYDTNGKIYLATYTITARPLKWNAAFFPSSSFYRSLS